MQPRLTAGRRESSACGSAAQVGPPMAGASGATPAAWAASTRTISCAAVPRTSTTSAGQGISERDAQRGLAVGDPGHLLHPEIAELHHGAHQAHQLLLFCLAHLHAVRVRADG